MFTGIIRGIGTVEALERGAEGARLRIASPLAGELGDGDSVAVAGACLTVAARVDGAFEADVMNQTLTLTTLGLLAPGDRANLEQAVRAGEPLGGHLVQGHVDGTAEVRAVVDDGFARRVSVATPSELRRYLVQRGSVAIDGVSLTVACLANDGFEVSLIPETLDHTTLGSLAAGDRVNLEVDQVARYVERLMQGFGKEGSP
jgi:riboflavin synthase alpha subunit